MPKAACNLRQRSRILIDSGRVIPSIRLPGEAGQFVQRLLEMVHAAPGRIVSRLSGKKMNEGHERGVVHAREVIVPDAGHDGFCRAW